VLEKSAIISKFIKKSEMKTDNQHWLRNWLRSLFKRNISATSSDLETLINKTSLAYDDLLELQFLTELDISDQQLTSVLPNKIGNYLDLMYLYLQNNNIKELPDEIVKLTNLINLTLYNHPNLILTDEQNKWLEKLCSASGIEPIINKANIHQKVLQKPLTVQEPKQKQKNIPTLDEWMDAEKKSFIQRKI